MPAIVTTSDLRIDVAGCPAVDGLTLATRGEHVLVLGAARALFEAAAGLRRIARGQLHVEGRPAVDAVRGGLVACAPLDAPMPPGWTAFQYVTWSARLAGHGRATARGLADDALARMQVTSMAGAKLGRAGVGTKRAVVLAAALATGAKTLLIDDPLSGLTEEAARPLSLALSRAVEDRRTALFAARMPLQSPLALSADEAVVVTGSQVAIQGAPAEIAAADRTFALRVHGEVDAFVRAVEGLGGRVVMTSGTAAPSHIRVDLGPLAARDLLRVAAGTATVVMELRPLARVFA